MPSFSKLYVPIIVFLLLLLIPVNSSCQIVLRQGDTTRFEILEENFQHIVFTNTFNHFELRECDTEKGTFLQMLTRGYTKSNTAGLPELPVLGRMIEIPYAAVAGVRIIGYMYTDYNLPAHGFNLRIVPAQPPCPKTEINQPPFAFDQNAYLKDGFIENKLVTVEIAGNMRASRLASLIVSPVQYNPVLNTLRIYQEIKAEIIFNGSDIGRTISEKHRLQSPFFSGASPVAANSASLRSTLATAVNHPVKYVIVSNPMFRQTLQPFVKWKTRKGFQVTEAYTDDPAVGTTITTIKSYLQQLYQRATDDDPAPTFVLLVGDVAQLPSFNCGTHVSDMYYCEYTGDNLPDAYYGRFSAQNTEQLQSQIEKTLQYEQYLMPDPSYLNHAVLTAGADVTHQLTWGNGQMSYAANYYFNEAHNITAHTYLQPEPSGAQYAQQIIANINQGVSFANYTAHGNSNGWTNPALNISAVNNLQNKDKYCMMIGNCCETSTFQKNSFGEELLRAPEKGALGYVGASDLSYWDEDYWWAVGNGAIVANPVYENKGQGTYDLTFHDHGEPREKWSTTMGQMLFAGNMAVQESNSTMKKYYWEVYCLLGDPSLMVYFSEPTALSVAYQHQLPLESGEFEVQTEPYAYVAVSKDHILYGAAEAGNDGIATVKLQPFRSSGKATVIVTKQNRRPYTDSLSLVSPEGSYPVLNNIRINDVMGNENGLAEPGEMLSLDTELKNLGKANTQEVTAQISTSDTFVEITDSIHKWGSIRAGDSLLAKHAFMIRVKREVPDMHKVRFNITCISNDDTVHGNFSVVLYAPQLVAGTITMSESFNGNSNSLADAGETMLFKLVVTNTGHSTSDSLKARLIVTNGNRQFSTAEFSYGNLPSGESLEMQFQYSIDQQTAEGSLFEVFVPIIADGYHTHASFNFTTGLQFEDFEGGDFAKSKVKSTGVKTWYSDSTVVFEGRYASRSGAIGHLDQSEMFIEANFLSHGNISFYRKTSCENGYDFLKFFVDGNELAAWSGNKDWTKVTFPVSAGQHKLSWSYIKDEATVSGKDAAWIDNIEFPPFSMVSSHNLDVRLIAIPPAICAGRDIQLFAFANGGIDNYSYQWQPSGILSSTTVFNPVAQTDTASLLAVTVQSGVFTASETISLMTAATPENPTIVLAGDHLESSAAEGNSWYDSKGALPGEVGRILYPDHNDTYYAIVTSPAGCPSQPSNTITFLGTGVNQTPYFEFGASPNPFTETLRISYLPSQREPIQARIVDVFGQIVAISGPNPAGGNFLDFDSGNWARGIYLCIIEAGKSRVTLKVIKK